MSSTMDIEPSIGSLDDDDVEEGQEIARNSLQPSSSNKRDVVSRGRMTMTRQRRQRRFMVGVILSLAVVGAVVALAVVLNRDASSSGSETVTSANNSLDNPDVDARSTVPATSSPTTVATVNPIPVTAPPSTTSTTLSPSTVPTLAPSVNISSNVFQATTAPPISTFPPTSFPTTASPTTPPPISTFPPTPLATTASPTTAPLAVTASGSFALLETVPHNVNAFTQGLEVLSWQRLKYGQEANTTTVADYMLESTGLYGASTLRLVEIATGQVIETLNVDSQYFAEGCTYYEMPDESETDSLRLKVVQLTWRSGTGFVYELFLDAAMSQTEDVTVTTTTAAVPFGLEQVGTFDIDTTNGEGWGIVYHPTLDQFIVSDGTDNLHFWELRENPAGENGNLIFERVRTQQVTQRFSTADSWTGVVRLNELEWDPYSRNGTTILANVWQTDYIVRIRLEDGKVTHRYDMSSLDRQSGADVLNGIAAVWDSVPADPSANNQFWVTGKRWDSMYRVRFEDD